MFPHPDTIATFVELREQDLRAAANGRQRLSAARPPGGWFPLAGRALAILALLLGPRA